MSYEWLIECNVLLIGKTGTGKSSFANYLFGTDRFTTGSGEPVTNWKENFQMYHFKISDITVNVFDSVGLEANNFDIWSEQLRDFLAKHRVCCRSQIHPANDIIHTIFYVINGASARIEASEIDIINGIAHDYGISASVIITNCDIASEEEMCEVESIIRKHGLESFRVCSVAKKTRGGIKEPSGKEPAIAQMLSASYEKVGKALTMAVLDQAMLILDDARQQVRVKIDAADLSIFNLANLDKTLDKLANSLEETLNDMGILDGDALIPPEYRSYEKFLDNFNINYQGRDIMNDTLDTFSNIIDELDENKITIIKKGNQAIEHLENGNILEKIDSVLFFAKVIFTLKETFKQAIDELFDIFIEELRGQREHVERGYSMGHNHF